MEEIQKWKQDCKMRNIKRLQGGRLQGGSRDKNKVSRALFDEEDEDDFSNLDRDERILRRQQRQLRPDPRAFNPFLQRPYNQNQNIPPPLIRRRNIVNAIPVAHPAIRRLNFGNINPQPIQIQQPIQRQQIQNNDDDDDDDDEDEDEEMEGEGNFMTKKNEYENLDEAQILQKYIRKNYRKENMSIEELTRLTNTYIHMVNDMKQNKRRDLLLELSKTFRELNVPKVITDIVKEYL